MSRELSWLMKGRGIKNRVTGTTTYKITHVQMNTQEQLKQILDDPKQYEDEKCQVPAVEMKNVRTLAEKFELLNLPEDTTALKQLKGQTNSSEATQCQDLVSPEYVIISNGLRERMEKFPFICSVPFFINLNKKALLNTTTACVSLPYTNNNLWKSISSQLVKIKQSCEQKGKLTFPPIFQSAIQVYRPDCLQWSNFQMLDRPDLNHMLRTTLPFIVDQALNLPNLVQNSIQLLLSNESKTVYLTRKLCCSLLANAFFCTFPEPKVDQMPDFNFFRLYNDTQSGRCEVKKEKMKCLLQYFHTMNKYENNKTFQNQIVSFERRFVRKRVDWINENRPLCEVKVEPHKKIEEAVNMLQVDFANKVIGGGVLNDGSVMEEIRFCISPELIVSRLLTQTLNENEVLVVTGTEIFSTYSGYSTSFTFEGPSNIDFEKQLLDNFGRTYTQIVAMDACSFRRNETAVQFQPALIDRELHKAYVAFIHGKAGISPVATGNWGCGAFNGNQELKFLIQWMAASHQGRPSMVYHTIGDKSQADCIEDLSGFLSRKGINVGELYRSISEFSSNIENQNIQTGALFQHIKQYFDI